MWDCICWMFSSIWSRKYTHTKDWSYAPPRWRFVPNWERIYASMRLKPKHLLQWRNPHWSIPVNEQVALWTEQVARPDLRMIINTLCNNIYRNINTNYTVQINFKVRNKTKKLN